MGACKNWWCAGCSTITIDFISWNHSFWTSKAIKTPLPPGSNVEFPSLKMTTLIRGRGGMGVRNGLFEFQKTSYRLWIDERVLKNRAPSIFASPHYGQERPKVGQQVEKWRKIEVLQNKIWTSVTSGAVWLKMDPIKNLDPRLRQANLGDLNAHLLFENR